MKQRINILTVLFAAGLTAGCGSGPSSVKFLKVNYTTLYSLDLKGKLGDDIPYYYQPSNTEHVYIFNPETGGVFMLHATEGRFSQVCKLPDISEDVTPVGFVVNECRKKISLYYEDSSVTYSMNGVRQFALAYTGISNTGFIYPADKNFLPLFKNDKMYASYFPNVEDGSKNPAYCKSPIEAMVDLRSNKVTLLQQTFPANYLKNYYPMGTQPIRMEISENVHAYCFWQNDSVFIRNIETGELNVKFFGSRLRKSFQYIPYDQINTVNSSAFKETGLSNPGYELLYNLPLAGYRMRNFIIPPGKNESVYKQYLVVFDDEFAYQGEIRCPAMFGWPIDSEKGILSMVCVNGVLTVKQLSW